jgi:hypothetical protein
MQSLKHYWYGWSKYGSSEQDAIMKCTQYSEFVELMRARCRSDKERQFYEPSTYYGSYKPAHYHNDPEYAGLRLASTHGGLANNYFSDFGTHYDHYFHYPSLPDEKKPKAKVIVDALNRLKGEAWAYALATTKYPDYDAHPLRNAILTEVKMEPETYDELIATMRQVHQG